MKILKDKIILITGGTGSLGQVLTKRLLTCEMGKPRKIIIFSRDEAKQHFMRLEYENNKKSTDEIIYNNFKRLIEFRIGDVRDYHSVCSALCGVDYIINAAALKQVPTCEYFPFEAVQTNVTGPQNIIRAIIENNFNIDTVVGISTDKACKPVNVMGMTKSLQERIFISANIIAPQTRFICVRYGNVLTSRGSVIPLFHEQIKSGGPVTVTTKDMTRFLLSLDKAVDTVFEAIKKANAGEIYIPKVPSSHIIDIAKILTEGLNIEIKFIGKRPGEKIHEILISEEESRLTYDKGNYYAIKSMLPELFIEDRSSKPLGKEYSSKSSLMNFEDTKKILESQKLIINQQKNDW